MKKLIMTVVALMGAFAVTAADTGKTEISLDKAKESISMAIEKQTVMEKTMLSLSNADQVKFVAAVNRAIGAMSGSVEQKTAAYLAVGEAALKAAAAKGNLLPVLAEIFATVPPNSLAFLSERFADTLFNRALNSNKSYTDAQVTESSKKVLAAIHEKTAGAGDTEVRDALAIAMLVRASNGSPKELAAELISVVSTDGGRQRMSKLVMAALAGKYDEVVPDKGEESVLPEPLQVLRFRDPQLLDAMESDLGDSLNRNGYFTTPMTEQLFELDDHDIARIDGVDSASRPLSDGDARFNPDAYQGQSR